MISAPPTNFGNSTEFPTRSEGDILATASEKYSDVKISSIMEEIMNEARLRKRAALRRRLAYHQGGSDGVEPKGFKSEDYHKYWEDDKHMHQTKSMGGDDGMFPGDEKVKEMQKRAKDKPALRGKIAYHQGGSDGVEPKTFKSQDYHKYWEDDKHMHQTKSMGGDDGMFPGDEKIKEMQKRAKYNGPALSTKFKQKRSFDGSINKAASCFEVYAGDKLVIAATARDIFGPTLDKNWDWLTSKDYAKTVVAEIRLLTKTAQAAPPPPPPAPPGADAAAPPPPPGGDMGMAPPPGGDMGMAPPPGGDMGGAPPGAEGGEEPAPKQVVEDALVVMEDNIEKIREALSDLAGAEDVDINVNVGKPGAEVEEGGEKLALSKLLSRQLKVALAEAKDSADELALLGETYDRYRSLSRSQQRELGNLTTDAIKDFSGILTDSTTLVSRANSVVTGIRKQAARRLSKMNKVASVRSPAVPETNQLVSKALDLRKSRRLDIIKTARRNLIENAADDVQDPDMGQISGVAEMSAMDVAMKAPVGGHHSPGKSRGKQDVKGMGKYTPHVSMAEDDPDFADDEAMDEAGYMADDEAMDEAGYMADDEAMDESMDMADDDEVMDESMDMADDDEVMDESMDMADDDEAMDESEDKHMAKDKHKHKGSKVASDLSASFLKKKAEEEREGYRVKLRRAYNVAMEMQRKGLIAQSRPALDRQVDSMMEFDDRAFEAFKRSVANFQGNVSNVKTASDVSGLNIGVTQDGEQATTSSGKIDAKTLATLWE
jgi:hypothetical protein